MMIALVAAGCGGDSATNPSASIAGTYSLKTVNGVALPFTEFQQGTNKQELLADVFVLSDGGSFTQSTTERITTNGQVTNQVTPDAGTFTVSGSTITLKFRSDNSMVSGTLGNGTITISDQGLTGIYQKQ